ncbi:hypothetical protein, partial [Veillonella sp.]|uniref:hypothetical protein n=1 Tax=Veillonella sp. TaxID=1926307 RepID=UPI001D9134C0
VPSGSSQNIIKHVEMAFSFYLNSEEMKGYFAISRQISATSAPLIKAKLFLNMNSLAFALCK